MRKLFNIHWRATRGYSLSKRASIFSMQEIAQIKDAIGRCQPTVTGELHDTGLKLLKDKRYAKRLEAVMHMIDDLSEFRLVDSYHTPNGGWHPIYEVISTRGYFRFLNIPWQSGGNGPKIWR